MKLKEDDVVLCNVEKIDGAGIFLKIDGEEIRGTMILPEVAAGRIRNLREYVAPGRKVVCKVLKIHKDHIELSLRRVTAKERVRVLEAYKKERALASILKIAGENAEKVIAKIKEKYFLVDFFDEFESEPKLLEEFLVGEKAKKVAQMFFEKSVKEKKVEKKFSLKSFSGSGVEDLKEILDFPDVEIHYLGSGTFSLFAKGADFKSAGAKIEEIMKEIESRAKKKNAVLELKVK